MSTHAYRLIISLALILRISFSAAQHLRAQPIFPTIAPLFVRQEFAPCTAGQTTCQDGSGGCCDYGAKCTSERNVPICQKDCGGGPRCTGTLTGFCCDIGQQCDYQSTGCSTNIFFSMTHTTSHTFSNTLSSPTAVASPPSATLSPPKPTPTTPQISLTPITTPLLGPPSVNAPAVPPTTPQQPSVSAPPPPPIVSPSSPSTSAGVASTTSPSTPVLVNPLRPSETSTPTATLPFSAPPSPTEAVSTAPSPPTTQPSPPPTSTTSAPAPTFTGSAVSRHTASMASPLKAIAYVLGLILLQVFC